MAQSDGNTRTEKSTFHGKITLELPKTSEYVERMLTHYADHHAPDPELVEKIIDKKRLAADRISDAFQRMTAYVAAGHIIEILETTASKHAVEPDQQRLKQYALQNLDEVKQAAGDLITFNDYTKPHRKICKAYHTYKDIMGIPIPVQGQAENGRKLETLDQVLNLCTPGMSPRSLDLEFRKRSVHFYVSKRSNMYGAKLAEDKQLAEFVKTFPGLLTPVVGEITVDAPHLNGARKALDRIREQYNILKDTDVQRMAYAANGRN